jgi:hypothetical protein
MRAGQTALHPDTGAAPDAAISIMTANGARRGYCMTLDRRDCEDVAC